MKSPGQIAYEAYCKHTDWESLVSKRRLPAWIDTTFEIQQAWEAAAKAVYDKVLIDRGIEVD